MTANEEVSVASPIRSVVVIHKSPEDFRAALELRFPSIRFEWIGNLDDVVKVLPAVKPDAVFSIAQAGFRCDAHRLAASYETVRWVHCGGSGYDHLLPLDRRRTTLTNCAGVLAPYLAEMVMGAILALNGNVLGYVRQQQMRCWRSLPFRPLAEQSLLVIGLGANGSRVARMASTLGMKVLGVARSPKESLSMVEFHPFAELRNMIGGADFVTVHVPLTNETRQLIDRSMIKAMKPGVVLINTSRGDVVDEDALIQALQTGHVRAAYLDVFREEPLPPTSPIWGLENVLVTPHSADAVLDWARKFSDQFSQNLERWNAGQPLISMVL